jgi:C-terminal processing protease CtpA/Prc
MRRMRGVCSAWFPVLVLGVVAYAPAPLAGQDRPGWIGVSVNVVTTGDETGSRTFVVVTDVQPGSPADAAGIRPGDALVEVNDMRDPDALRQMAERLRLNVGDAVRLVLRRGDQQREMRIVATARPQILTPPRPTLPQGLDADSVVASIMLAMDAMRANLAEQRAAGQLRAEARRVAGGQPAPPAPPRPDATPRVWVDVSGAYSPLAPYVLGRNRVAGAEVIDVRPDLARYFGVDGGVLVVDVPAGTPAEQAQLRAGDVIVQLGDMPVRTVEELRLAVARAGSTLPLWLIRHGERVQLVLPR